MKARTQASSIKRILNRDPSVDQKEDSQNEEHVQELVQTDIDEVVSVESDAVSIQRPTKGSRGVFKERGSILSKMDQDVAIPNYSRTRNPVYAVKGKGKERKAKKQDAKAPNLDIYIPSVISVGNLARLLNVRPGKFCNV